MEAEPGFLLNVLHDSSGTPANESLNVHNVDCHLSLEYVFFTLLHLGYQDWT